MKIKGANILVTGGAGFIGSHIVDSLVKLGAKVTVYDDFSTGKLENLQQIKNSIKIIDGDILDQKKLFESISENEIVSHQAAQLEIFKSTYNPEDDLEINTIGTLNVLKAAKKYNISKVINASSACIYGQVDGKTDENHYPRPNWAYGVSKLAAEKYCDIFNDYQNVPTVNLRYSITYGEREWFRRVLSIFIKMAINNQPLVIFGDGKQVRDFIYVKDVVKMHNLCIENDNSNGQSYNVGSGTGTSITELANKVITASEKKLEIVYENIPEGAFSKLVPDKKRNTAELKTMLLDNKKARQELGWQPQISLVNGIRNEFEWAKENIDRWDKIQYTVV